MMRSFTFNERHVDLYSWAFLGSLAEAVAESAAVFGCDQLVARSGAQRTRGVGRCRGGDAAVVFDFDDYLGESRAGRGDEQQGGERDYGPRDWRDGVVHVGESSTDLAAGVLLRGRRGAHVRSSVFGQSAGDAAARRG